LFIPGYDTDSKPGVSSTVRIPWGKDATIASASARWMAFSIADRYPSFSTWPSPTFSLTVELNFENPWNTALRCLWYSSGLYRRMSTPLTCKFPLSNSTILSKTFASVDFPLTKKPDRQNKICGHKNCVSLTRAIVTNNC
jgi:hypothetical protein